MQLRQLDEYPFAPFIISEYVYLAGRSLTGSADFDIPFIGEIIEETWLSVSHDARAQQVQDAIMRNEHEEIYSLNKRVFTKLAMQGDLKQFETSPIKMFEVHDQVTNYLNTRNISHINWNKEFINSPIGRGVW